MGIWAKMRKANIDRNKNKATEKYGSDVGAKFSSEDYAADEKKVLAAENEGKRMFSGGGVYTKAGKDEKVTFDAGTTIGKGTASDKDNVAGLFGTKRPKLFS